MAVSRGIFIGIDPGLTGAISIIGDGMPRVYDMPLISKLRCRKGKRVWVEQVDELELGKLMDSLSGASKVVTIEDLLPMSKRGAIAAFSLGRSFGIVLGVVSSLGFAYQLVSPSKWKREFDLLRKDKPASIVVAKKLFPGAAEFMTEKTHHGRAEALLLAEYGRRIGQ